MISSNMSPLELSAGSKVVSSQFSGRLKVAPQPFLIQILDRVFGKLTPLSALQEYVAVNPMAGFTDRSMLEAREWLRRHSDADLLLPLSHYGQLIADGELSWDDVQHAVKELRSEGIEAPDALEIAKEMAKNAESNGADSNRIRTVSEILDAAGKSRWREVFIDEISSICSDFFDEGQAFWNAQASKVSLFHAWREKAEHDRNLEVSGLSGFRQNVAGISPVSEVAIEQSLRKLRVPEHLWESYLLVHCFSTFGWSVWCRSATEVQKGQGQHCNYVIDLLAIRLTMETQLADLANLQLDWEGVEGDDLHWARLDPTAAMRNVLLRASELRYRDTMLSSLRVPRADTTRIDRHLAQFAFCIDVRSERLRRGLEASKEVQTVGVAGFFNLPMQLQRLGQDGAANERPDQQLPILLKPQFTVFEPSSGAKGDSKQSRIDQRSWKKYWSQFAKLPLSAFALVESLGAAFAVAFLQRWWSGTTERTLSGRPELCVASGQGIGLEKQADLMEALLKNMGITQDFAKFVVICGHQSKSVNNPLHASLQCGACGGHSGEANARLAASMLNDPALRERLALRGLVIPEDTFFLAAVHETQSDQLHWFDLGDLPGDCQSDLARLRGIGATACRETLQERSQSEGRSMAKLKRQGSDWSEIRPEWGLAGNALFIAAPRSWTRGIDLEGRAFLHEYDAAVDKDNKVLETILTAPVVVAHWINFQYYASCVDQKHFGSDSKSIHNVVGKFGILSGNGGDLRTGLPWESLHDGQRFQHQPLRLQVVIAADRDRIESVLQMHPKIRQLVLGQWLHLMVMEEEKFYRLNSLGEWVRC